MTVIDPDRFLFYADYFAFAGEAGQQSADTLCTAVSNLDLLDTSTFVNNDQATNALALFRDALQVSCNSITILGDAIDPMSNAFEGLAKHIRDEASQTVNQYIEDHGLQVERTYAQLSNLFGSPIDEENIKV